MKRKQAPCRLLCVAVLVVELILLIFALRQQLPLPVFWALTVVVGIVAAMAIILAERRRALPSRAILWRILGRMLTLLAMLLYAALVVLPRGIPSKAHLVSLALLIAAFFCFIAEMSLRERADKAG